MEKSSSKNIAIFISGRGSNFKSILDHINEINGEIKIVISNKNALGLNYAKEKNIQTLISNDFEKISSIMEELNIDLIVLAGYLKILPKNFVKKFFGKIINIHPSLIPSFCGKNFYGEKVHEAAINRGVRYSGCTTHFVSDVVDGGPIILQKTVEVSQNDTPKTLAEKILIEEHKIIVESVKLFCDDLLTIKGERVIIK
ncbi:MAG: phosphoribosylglycinamide formyltransferase [Peptoniphilaceae bacterium]|nr:phosphoribosylglycinamide formyltransferase [Peptoniphilaceae bacterium]MDY3738630.1 phosphoribosylglycinamide formyltransferase [Peptoniphilaceae bacterium]